jgi:hypothetical protein
MLEYLREKGGEREGKGREGGEGREGRGNTHFF